MYINDIFQNKVVVPLLRPLVALLADKDTALIGAKAETIIANALAKQVESQPTELAAQGQHAVEALREYGLTDDEIRLAASDAVTTLIAPPSVNAFLA